MVQPVAQGCPAPAARAKVTWRRVEERKRSTLSAGKRSRPAPGLLAGGLDAGLKAKCGRGHGRPWLCLRRPLLPAAQIPRRGREQELPCVSPAKNSVCAAGAHPLPGRAGQSCRSPDLAASSPCGGPRAAPAQSPASGALRSRGCRAPRGRTAPSGPPMLRRLGTVRG
ncbi:uncharacterized protein ACIGJ3_007342 [Trichechus inunguis]